jgi:Transglycosylase SLT domain
MNRLRPKVRRALRLLWTAPVAVRVAATLAVVAILCAAVNWMVQVWRKPSEMLFPVGQALVKSPAATWREYGPLFREHSTPVISAELLAALAQVEGAGNPAALPGWSWRWSRNPFEWYRPASSAVGMFQITDSAFRDAKRYCIHDHAVAEDGPWYDLGSCWFNGLYTRVLPGDAIEMTSGLLHRSVAAVVGRHPDLKATLAQKQDLAAVIHLCGFARGEAFARRGFRSAPEEHCGTQPLRSYLIQVGELKRRFAALAAAE